MKILIKRTMLVLLFFAFYCGALMLFGNTSITVYAYEQNEIHEHDNMEGGLESYIGYGCNNGVSLQVNLSGQTENLLIESIDGFGHGDSCGGSREGGYSSSYYCGCRNWQVMPLFVPMFKYWIDESSLSSLTTTDRAKFIADVDGAAAEWNSVRINDYPDAIVNLQKMSSNGTGVVPIRYNPSLSGAAGKFNPIPLFEWIEIKYLNDPETILHEFGHMIGLQDLDMGKDPIDYSHISLMGYAGDDKMHYQDIQGLAVANYKHTNHDFRKYWRDGAWYKYVCFYCDITDSVLTPWSGGTQLDNASSCLHTYERLASAGSRYWQKCTNCYKVIESEFTVNVKGSNSVEITGLIDNRTTIIIPRQIGGQNVTSIGIGAFSGHTNITSVIFEATSNVTTIGHSSFRGVTRLSQILIPASVTNIDVSAFENCTSLTNVTLPNNLTRLGDFTFKNCTSIESIVIPNNVTYIGNYTFENCTSLTNVTLPNNSISLDLGDYAFKNCTSLESIVIPNNVTYIGAYTFDNCSSLIEVTLSNSLTTISLYAFRKCESLTSITLPKSMILIGTKAFQDCIKLENVSLLREESTREDEFTNIVYLGPSAFQGCNILKEIIVPTNRIAEYKNQVNWSTYSHLIVPSTEFDEHNLNCFSNFNITTSLEAGYNKLYKFEVECPKSYKIISNSSSAIKMKLYNSNMNLMSTSNEIITSYLSPGIYYLDLSFIDNSSSGDINTSFGLLWVHNGWDISYNKNNDVLTHLHEIEPNVYKNKLQYYNDEGAGFYEFYLEGTNIGGSIPYCKEGAITIYSDSSRNNILSKFAGYSTEAKTSENINRMVVYLPRDGYFYIDINMSSNNLETLDLRINPLVSQEVNLFNLAENTDESINIFNETTYGEYFQKLKINQVGRFTVYASYSGLQNNTLFVLAKLNYNPALDTYTLETKITDILSAKDYPVPKTLTLDEGTYYIGYFNKNDDISLNVSIDRLVTLSGSQVLLSDPEVGALCGSQINIIEMNESIKSYRETFITKDFTRILYPNYNYIYQTSSSRLDYDWYSSDENIATVTPYGTVLGKNVGNVKIMAVLKTDPSKVFVKEYTIIADTGTDPIEVNSTYTVKYSETDNGTFRLNLEKVNCPYPWFQDYTWNVFILEQYNDLIVEIDVWGNTTINKTGSFELTGTYLKNSRVTVKIAVIIEP